MSASENGERAVKKSKASAGDVFKGTKKKKAMPPMEASSDSSEEGSSEEEGSPEDDSESADAMSKAESASSEESSSEEVSKAKKGGKEASFDEEVFVP